MSKVHISVERLFGNIINNFECIDLKKKLKIGLSGVGKMYIVCTLSCNAFRCFQENLMSEYLGLSPPRVFWWTVWVTINWNNSWFNLWGGQYQEYWFDYDYDYFLDKVSMVWITETITHTCRFRVSQHTSFTLDLPLIINCLIF